MSLQDASSDNVRFGKEPTDEERERVYKALVDGEVTPHRFVQWGTSIDEKALNDDLYISSAFSLNDYASGKYVPTKPEHRKRN